MAETIFKNIQTRLGVKSQSEQLSQLFGEIHSVQKAINVLRGHLLPTNSETVVNAPRSEQRYKIDYNKDGNIEFSFEKNFNSNGNPKKFQIKGNFQSGTLELSGERSLHNNNNFFGFGSIQKANKSLTIKNTLKKILKDQRKQLDKVLKADPKLTLEEYFLVSLEAERNKNPSKIYTLDQESDKLFELAKKLYLDNQDIFKHSNTLGEYLLDKSKFTKFYKENIKYAQDKFKQLNTEKNVSLYRAKITDLSLNFSSLVANLCDALKNGDSRFDRIYSISYDKENIFLIDKVTQDRMMKFETVEVLGRHYGNILEIYVFDDGLVKYWKIEQMDFLSPIVVFQNSYLEHIHGVRLTPVTDVNGETNFVTTEGEPQQFAQRLPAKTASIDEIVDACGQLQHLANWIKPLCDQLIPHINLEGGKFAVQAEKVNLVLAEISRD
jgi:hypothetical protein